MWRYIVVFLLTSLGWAVVLRGWNRGEVTSVSGLKDTVRVVRVDTVRIVEPMAREVRTLRDVVEVRVVDTIYQERVVYAPRQQHHYGENDLYDLWVSGVEPRLDSVRFYHRNEVVTVGGGSASRWSLYGSVRLSNGSYPSVGLFFTSRGRFACGVDVGGLGFGEPTYSFTLAYRLLGR